MNVRIYPSFRGRALAIAFVLVAAPVAAQKLPLVPIYVTTAAIDAEADKGFTSTPPSEVVTLRKQIEKHSGRMKGDVLVLATTRADAAVRFEFVDATKKQVAGSPLLSWSATKNEYTVRGTLVVGELRKDFTATDGDLVVALHKMGAAVETFVRDNRARIAGGTR